MSPAFLESFRAVRWLRTLNLVLQAVLFLTFFGGLNYVARNHPSRFDLTKYRKFSLSPETLSYIKNLDRPVHIVMTTSPDSDNPEVRGLIDEYIYATQDRPAGKITREVIDVYQNRKRAEELGLDRADIILVLSGDRRRVEDVNSLYTVKDRKREAFRGEQTLTAAILDVSMPDRKKIYFLEGHSELRIDETDPQRGLSSLRDALKLRNFDVETLSLTAARSVPADAALLVIVQPKNKYQPVEQEMLRRYLSDNAGRMLVFLEPGLTTAALGLDDLLLDWGVISHNDLIIDLEPGHMADNQDLLLFAFLRDPPHPITKTLQDYKQHLRVGRARTVMPDPGRSSSSGIHTVTLVATSKSAWGERDPRPPLRFDPTVDSRPLPGMEPPDRLGVIVASERLAARDNLPFSVRGGKIVVFGTGDLVANSRLDQANFSVFLNAVNWSVDRDRQLSIPPRPVERFGLSLSATDSMRLRYVLLLGLPGAALLLGGIVYWTRRS
jgi:hypothetical protein